MDPTRRLALLEFQAGLHTHLRGVRDARKVLTHAIRGARELFGAEEAVVAALRPGRPQAEIVFATPAGSEWDVELLTLYLRGARPPIPPRTLMAPVQRRGRNWAVLALRDRRSDPPPDRLPSLFAITQNLTDVIRSLDEARIREVRRKIERKIADRQNPKDLIYDILHGLRSLTRYDHSAALLISPEEGSGLKLIAEQIAWTKAKSQKIGLTLGLDAERRARLRAGGVQIFERAGSEWRSSAEDGVDRLPELLDYNRAGGDSPIPVEVAILCAPIAAPDGTLGVLKIAARRPDVLGAHEAALVEEFLPLASLAIQFSVRTESLEARMLASERKHALANLTRGIAHDVNNALGAMLPLVQQLREDLRARRLDEATLAEDLDHVERSIQTCRRIFAGMLAIARGSSRSVGQGNLRRAVESVVSMLEESFRRRSIRASLDLPDALPSVQVGQGDLTQLFLNVCSNARDAMPNGGRLSVSARARGPSVEVLVEDTGAGIPAEVLQRIPEPFFTTKRDGNGLGLSICRSIVWGAGGDMSIESEERVGTRVLLSLPVVQESFQEVPG